MSAASRREFGPTLPDDSPFLSLGILSLVAMPTAQRNAVLTLVDILNNLPKEELAILAKSVQPYLTDDEVADLCGVSTRTLYNWERFQSWKPSVADYLETKRRQWYIPDDSAA